MAVKVNVEDALGPFQDTWSPKVAGTANGMDDRLAKFRGEFLRHRHGAEDELFLVCPGVLLMRLRDGELRRGPGEFVVAPREGSIARRQSARREAS